MVRVVAQRVRSASVTVDGEVIGAIDRGMLLLVGIAAGDDQNAVHRLADKVAVLRIFEDDQGKMNHSNHEVGGAFLAVSQFTLYGDLKKGRRPSFLAAAPPALGEALYEEFCRRLRGHDYRVDQGRFGAKMLVSLENDGPVTLLLDSDEL